MTAFCQSFALVNQEGAEFQHAGPLLAPTKPNCSAVKTEEKEGLWEVARGATAQSRSHGRPRKYVPSQHSDKMIRTAYIDFRKRGDRAVLLRAALRLGWPSHVVSRRARELGVVPVAQQRPWSRPELAILKNGVLLGAETIRRQLRKEGFHRSISSILAEKRHALVPLKIDHSAREVALSLGVDPHKVLLWIRRGLLLARRRNGSRWMISADAVRDFVFAYPQQFDLAKADKLWLLELLEGKQKKRRSPQRKKMEDTPLPPGSYPCLGSR